MLRWCSIVYILVIFFIPTLFPLIILFYLFIPLYFSRYTGNKYKKHLFTPIYWMMERSGIISPQHLVCWSYMGCCSLTDLLTLHTTRKHVCHIYTKIPCNAKSVGLHCTPRERLYNILNGSHRHIAKVTMQLRIKFFKHFTINW